MNRQPWLLTVSKRVIGRVNRIWELHRPMRFLDLGNGVTVVRGRVVPWRDPRDKRSQERKNTQLDIRRTENLRNRY